MSQMQAAMGSASEELNSPSTPLGLLLPPGTLGCPCPWLELAGGSLHPALKEVTWKAIDLLF